MIISVIKNIRIGDQKKIFVSRTKDNSAGLYVSGTYLGINEDGHSIKFKNGRNQLMNIKLSEIVEIQDIL